VSEIIISSNTGTDNVEHEQQTHRDDMSSKIGMWLFLLTEVLLFGGLFLLYMAYRLKYSGDFHNAALELNVKIGTFNTLILITSSLTMALSIAAMQRARKGLSIFLLVSTQALGIFFLVNKFFEWFAKFEHGLYPGASTLLGKPKGEYIFFGMYYAMTGLHALHVIAGLTLLTFMLVFTIRNKITSDNCVRLENSGLYWHLVDLIWIFLFPLFYLMR
jgi:cytochrome c oxidase subunit 3